ncbi:hypothetical protein [Ruegeria sp.]|uniref:hypothetical protein n=1 Tax=Ruegeria sp. TaxID=1879320 RepID=UPI003B5BA3B0
MPFSQLKPDLHRDASVVPATRYTITGPRKSPTATSSRNVLNIVKKGQVKLEAEAFDNLHIHHIDSKNSEVFWCRLKDNTAVLDQSFYYQAIRQNAVEGYGVRFEDLMPWQRPLQARPVFIFSIGRCGSTLFAKICQVAGLLTWSEPDTFTNLAVDARLQDNPAKFRMLTRVALTDLADKTLASGRSDMGIKLRSHVTPICEDLCGHHPDAVCFFLVREPIAWARSRFRLWGARPSDQALALSTMVGDMRLAKARGLNVNVLSYDALVENPQKQAQRIAHEIGGPEIDPSALEEILGQDSQGNTTIGRASGNPVPDDFNGRFVKALRTQAPHLLERDPEMWLD